MRHRLCSRSSLATGIVFVLRTAAALSVATHRKADLSHIHVVYAADPGAFQGLLSSMLSISRNLERPQDCSIHLVVAEEDGAQARSLVECFQEESGRSTAAPAVLVHEVRHEAVAFDPSKIIGHPHLKLSKANFFRFYIAEIMPDVDRVLYLDTDTIVRSDVGPLYRTPMQHAYACAREKSPIDSFLMAQPLNASNLLRYMPDRTVPQMQTGVAVIDLRRWRSEGITRACEEWAAKLGTYSAQLILNLEFQSRRGFDTFDETWNLYGMGLPTAFERWVSATPNWTPAQLASARILHFSGSSKPWSSRPRSNRTATYQELYGPYAPHRHCSALNAKLP